MNYRAEIDGLRGLAVTSVLLYHAKIFVSGNDLFEGGFVGVDIFFVISGYLISLLILTEIKHSNRFDFFNFYEKRARRILPMLLVVVMVSTPLAWMKLLPIDLVDFAKSALSALGFSSNFYLYFSTTEYGADQSLLKPLLHTWSLSVEEQFYIFFPLIVLLCLKVSSASLFIWLCASLFSSFLFSDIMSENFRELNFFLPFSRFWELLVGSLLAFFEWKYGKLKNPVAVKIFPLVGLFLIVCSVLSFDHTIPHPGSATLVPVIGTALVIAFCQSDVGVGKILSFSPLVGIGLISYSLYLWHFPVFAFGRVNSLTISNVDKVEWFIVSLGLSVATYYLIEKPFRNRNFIGPRSFLFVLLCSTLVIVSSLMIIVFGRGYPDRVPAILSKSIDEKPYNKFKQDGRRCYERKGKFCNIHNGNSKTTIYSFGDSHLASFSAELVDSLESEYNYLEAHVGGCIFVLDAFRQNKETQKKHRCSQELNLRRYKAIEKENSIVVIGGRFPRELHGDGFNNQEGGYEGPNIFEWKTTSNQMLEQKIIETISTLVNDGHQVILIYPIPEVGVNVPRYIFQSVKGKNISDVSTNFTPLTTSFSVYKERSRSTFELFDSLESPNIHRVYPHILFCNSQIYGRCMTHNNEHVFYADDDHLSGEGAKMLADLVMQHIDIAVANINGPQ